jgi:DNA-binding SARP family transcriptional activator
MDIHLLGPVQFATASGVVEAGPPQRCLVLAALAASVGRTVSTSMLVSRVWGDDPPHGARRSVHAHISVLRRLLTRHSAGTARITSRAGGYLLDLGAGHVDVLHARHLVEQARAEVGLHLVTLREAVTLWRGEPLAGLTSPWATAMRRHWRREYREMLLAWSSAELAAGHPGVVVEQLTDAVRTHPEDQRLAAVLMRVLYAGGDTQAALAVYRAAHERIVRADGLIIGPELARVHLGVLRGDLDAEAVAPAPVAAGLPVLAGAIPPQADNFQVRAVADALRRAAGPGRTTVLAQVVAGLGGVGKTQLAARFARGLIEDGEVDVALWISALSRDSVVSGYVRAGVDLALGPGPEAPEHTAGRLLAWLATTSRRWLVVLDDLAGPAEVRDLWPPDSPNGRTVVTTRRRDADLLAGRDLVDVGVFTEAEALTYVTRKLASRPYLADDVRGVVADLGALPLALAHAAAYMLDLELPCSAYRARFADRHRRLAELFPDAGTLYEGNSRTVATTWHLSIDAADRLPPAGLARPLLALVSSLNPNGIPEDVLTAPSARAHLAGRLGRAAGHDEIRDGLRGLHRFHLITHDASTIGIHALVQRAVREDLGEDQAGEVARAAADAVLEIWPALDAETGQLLRANAMALQDNWPAAIWDPAVGIHPVMTRTIASLGAAVQLDEAIGLCERLGRHAAEHLGIRHHDTLELRNQLATWLGDAGRTQEAILALTTLVPDTTAALGPDHPTTLAARGNLGYQWGQAGHPGTAVAMLDDVLCDETRVHGSDSPQVLTTRTRLVYWRSKAGDTADEISELEDLVRLCTRIHGETDRQTFELRGLLASARAELVGHTQAAAEMRAVLDDMRHALGPTHRDVSVLRLNLAARLRLAGEFTTAAAQLRDLLTERIRSHGPYHRDTVATQHVLAEVLSDLGEHSAAATELEAVVEGLRRLAGPLHPDTLRCRHDLAVLWLHEGRTADADTLLTDVLNAQRTVLGDGHADVAATRATLARM